MKKTYSNLTNHAPVLSESATDSTSPVKFYASRAAWITLSISMPLVFLLFYDERFLLLALPILIVTSILAFYFGFRGLIDIRYLRLKNGTARLVFGALILLIFGLPFVFKGGIYWAAKKAKLEINKTEYLKAANAAPPDERGMRFHVFPWGGFMLTQVDLVYDESAELALPSKKRTPVWLKYSERTSYDDCSIQRLSSKFFIAVC